MDFSGKAAISTGAASGMGLLFAELGLDAVCGCGDIVLENILHLWYNEFAKQTQ